MVRSSNVNPAPLLRVGSLRRARPRSAVQIGRCRLSNEVIESRRKGAEREREDGERFGRVVRGGDGQLLFSCGGS